MSKTTKIEFEKGLWTGSRVTNWLVKKDGQAVGWLDWDFSGSKKIWIYRPLNTNQKWVAGSTTNKAQAFVVDFLSK
jgi:hypothetical protein